MVQATGCYSQARTGPGAMGCPALIGKHIISKILNVTSSSRPAVHGQTTVPWNRAL
jgi:hypothetical protein